MKGMNENMNEHDLIRDIIKDDMPDIALVRANCINQPMHMAAGRKPSTARLVRRIAIAAAVLIFTTTATAFAVSPELREAVMMRIGKVSTDGQSVTAEAEMHQINDVFQAYVEKHEGTPGGVEQVGDDEYVYGGDSYREYWLGFTSYDEVAEFFGARFILSPLLDESSIVDLGAIYDGYDIKVDSVFGGKRNIVACMHHYKDTINRYGEGVRSDTMHMHEPVRAMAQIGAQFIYDDEGTIVTVYAQLFLSEQLKHQPSDLSRNIKSTVSVSSHNVDYFDYTSPVSGVIAVIGVYQDYEDNEGGFTSAKYTLDDVVYEVMCIPKGDADAVDILKAIIDSLG